MNLAERLEAINPLLASSLGSSIRLLINSQQDLWAVRVDVSEFELALVNVVLNARDAMPEGGAITITAENVQLYPGQVPEDLVGEFVAIAVADTGCGIPADILPKVFDPFFTTKKESKGTGLGLPQVHGFVHQSGGTVTVQSELGRGTCVTIFLPRGHAARQSEQDAPRAALSGGLALLVEDNPEVAEATSRLLE